MLNIKIGKRIGATELAMLELRLLPEGESLNNATLVIRDLVVDS
jgi:hypothetical protein